MRLPFRRTQKPVAPRVYEPGADNPAAIVHGLIRPLFGPDIPEMYYEEIARSRQFPHDIRFHFDEMRENPRRYCPACPMSDYLADLHLRRERETIA